MHCCLHLCGQPVSVGRLDQLLIDYYRRDTKKGTLTPEQVIDDNIITAWPVHYNVDQNSTIVPTPIYSFKWNGSVHLMWDMHL